MSDELNYWQIELNRSPVWDDSDVEDLGVHICASVGDPDLDSLFFFYRKEGFAINVRSAKLVHVDRRLRAAEKSIIRLDGIEVWRA